MEYLLEERLQHGANKWRRGLFEGHGEEMEEDHPQIEHNWRSTASDEWDTIASGKPLGTGFRKQCGTGW